MAETTTDIANKLLGHMKNMTEAQGLAELYHPEATSVEAMPNPETGQREIKGLDAIKAKHEWWAQTMEMIDGTIDGPYPHGEDRFAFFFKMKGKDKASGNIMDMEEVGVYHVADGKIVREEFFYSI
ncbi:MAG: nuclear transport factor 2 family protein [Pseudomonadota bacterium]